MGKEFKKMRQKYDEANHDMWVQMLKGAKTEVLMDYIEYDPHFIAAIEKPTKKMIGIIISKDARGCFKYVAKHADASQQAEATRRYAPNLQYIAKENPKKISKKAITEAFRHGGEWFKDAFFANPSEDIQMAAVTADPDLIRWCINPCVNALTAAIVANPRLMWVAMDKKAEVEKKIQSIKKNVAKSK